MGTMASQITSLTIVYSTVYLGADQRKHESSASLAFVRGIHRGPVNFPHKWPVTLKMFPFDDVIMVMIYTSINKAVIISDNDLSPVQCQAIIWANVDLLSVTHYRTYFNEILFENQVFFQQNEFENVISVSFC